MDSIVLYTDISFDPQSFRAAMGYLYNDAFTIKMVDNTTNTEAELKCIIWAIESLIINPEISYIVHTDCKTAVDLQLKPRFNKPIYSELIAFLNKHQNVRLIHLEGHKRAADKDHHDVEFSSLDKAVRKSLRADRSS